MNENCGLAWFEIPCISDCISGFRPQFFMQNLFTFTSITIPYNSKARNIQQKIYCFYHCSNTVIFLMFFCKTEHKTEHFMTLTIVKDKVIYSENYCLQILIGKIKFILCAYSPAVLMIRSSYNPVCMRFDIKYLMLRNKIFNVIVTSQTF